MSLDINILTRREKGSILSHDEMDDNLVALRKGARDAYDKAEEGVKGWTPDTRDEEYEHTPEDIRIIRKLVGYINGDGEPPTANVGLYLKADGEYTDVKADAMDYKADSFISSAFTLMGNDESTGQAPKDLTVEGLTLADGKVTVNYENLVANYNASLGTNTILTNGMTGLEMFQNLQKQIEFTIKTSGNQSILGALTLGMQPSSLNGTELFRDRYSTGSLTSVGVMRSEGALYFGRGLRQKENDTGFVSTTTLNQEKTLLLIKFDGIYFAQSPAGVVPVGDNVTGLITYKVWTSKDTTIPAFTATKLLTPRTINGVPFDGSAPIVIYDNTKQPLEDGKGLTQENYSPAEKAKLAAIDATHYLAPVQSITALKAKPQATLTDKSRVFVEDEKADYFYDAQSTGTDPTDEAPNDQVGGVGFWRKTDLGGETAVSIMTKYESNADRNPLTDARRIKLDSVENGATANSTDANLKNRANHTGSQLAATISDFAAAAVSALSTALGLKANLSSPAFTDTPTAPTPAVGTNTTQIATAALVKATGDTKVDLLVTLVLGTTTAIQFDKPREYGTNASPITAATITTNATGALVGIAQKLYILRATAPTFPTEWKMAVGSVWSATKVNRVYAQYEDSTHIFYTIASD